MELKFDRLETLEKSAKGSNRTFMELKYDILVLNVDGTRF